MPPTPTAPGSVRPAAVVNADIRALWDQAGHTLGPADQDRYRQLLAEWDAAARTEDSPAAA